MRPNSHTIIHFFYVSDSSSALTLLTTDTFWLSQAPFTPGSWFPGAGTPRLATIAHFRLSAGTSTGTGGAELLLFNTHLDHVSDPQRRLGAAMLLHRARHEARVKPGVLIFVTGDFNRCGAYLNPLPYTFRWNTDVARRRERTRARMLYLRARRNHRRYRTNSRDGSRYHVVVTDLGRCS